MITLQKIKDLELINIIEHDFSDGWTLIFEDKEKNIAKLAIFNKVVFSNINTDIIKKNKLFVKNLKNSKTSIIINFNNNASITIMTDDESYNGPEALIFEFQGKIMVI